MSVNVGAPVPSGHGSIGQHHANADRAGPFQVAQEPAGVGCGL